MALFSAPNIQQTAKLQVLPAPIEVNTPVLGIGDSYSLLWNKQQLGLGFGGQYQLQQTVLSRYHVLG